MVRLSSLYVSASLPPLDPVAQLLTMRSALDSPFPRHPAEITSMVASYCDPCDLISFLSTNSRMNKLLTPVLYAHIDVGAWDNILMCLHSLALQPEECAFGRDRAALVQTFSIRSPMTRRPFYATDMDLAHSFLASVPRMKYLRGLSCHINIYSSINIFNQVAIGTFPSLRYLDLQLADVPIKLPQKALSVKLRLPCQLRSLSLTVPHCIETPLDIYVRKFINSCSKSLQMLSIYTTDSPERKDRWTAVLPFKGDLSALSHLGIVSAALDSPLVALAASVTSLSVRGNPPDCTLSEDAFPAVRELSCFASMLPIFLPEHTEQARAVSTVVLDEAYQALTRSKHSWRQHPYWDPPSWRRVLKALEHLPYSAVPVTTLAFAVSAIETNKIALAAPYMGAVRELTIAMRAMYTTEWLLTLAAELLPSLPQLQVLRVLKDVEPSGLLDIEILSIVRDALPSFSHHASLLQRLVFSPEIELVRRDDDWIWDGWSVYDDGDSSDTEGESFELWDEQLGYEEFTEDSEVDNEVGCEDFSTGQVYDL